MKFFRALCLILSITIISGIVIFGVNEQKNNNVVVTEYNFSHPKIPKAFVGYKILLISDLHNAPFADIIIEHIRNTDPDLIAFTGDMVQLPHGNAEKAVKIAKAFSDTIPIFAVSGNHEMQNLEYWQIYNALFYAGTTWLENDGVSVKRGSDKIRIAGIEDPKHNVLTEEHVEEIVEEIHEEIHDESLFSILLSHRADLYPYIKNEGADLILSGHLHGGIVRLPFIGGLIDKDDRLFPQYDYGFIQEEGASAMIVSGGCDKNPDKKRFWNPPEIVLITLDN